MRGKKQKKEECEVITKEKVFWSQLSIENLYSLYRSLSATPNRVLDMMEELNFINVAQERVYGYMATFLLRIHIRF